MLKAFSNRKFFAVLLVTALLLGLLTANWTKAEKVTDLDEGFVSIEDFGATRDDSKDDYAAFEAAIATGKGIYIPEGKYVTSKPIVIENTVVRGVGSAVSTIVGDFEDKNTPIMVVKGRSTVTDIYFRYDNTDINADEKQGERVGLQIGDSTGGLEAGSVIRNLFFNFVGTAIYCPADSSCNGVLFDTIEVQQYSYSGVDMQCEGRVNNTYSNFYINDQGYFKCVYAGIVLEGSEYAPVLNQINIEHGARLYGLVLKNIKGFNIGAIHFEGIAISQDDMGVIYAENSSGAIADLTYILNFVRCYNSSIIRVGNSETKDAIRVGNINVRGVNQPHDTLIAAREDWMEELGGLQNRGLKAPQAKTFVIFERDAKATGEYEIAYENYAFYSYHDDEYDFFAGLPCRGNVTVNQISERGAE